MAALYQPMPKATARTRDPARAGKLHPIIATTTMMRPVRVAVEVTVGMAAELVGRPLVYLHTLRKE